MSDSIPELSTDVVGKRSPSSRMRGVRLLSETSELRPVALFFKVERAIEQQQFPVGGGTAARWLRCALGRGVAKPGFKSLPVPCGDGG